jgi:general secretion pathway protein F
MTQFHYQAATPQGKLIEGMMEASEERIVASRLQDQGFVPLRIAEPGQAQAKTGAARRQLALSALPSLPRRGRVKQRDLQILTRELATLISAGLPLDRALSVASNLADKAELKQAISQILRSVQQGKSFAEALEEFPKIFPPLYVNMVKAGEVGGFLDTALQRLAEYLERAQEVQDEIKSALAYPVILVVVGSLSIVFMFTFVLPKFTSLFKDMGDALPTSTKLLLAISAGLQSYWWVLVLLSVGSWLGFRQYLATPQGRFAWDRWRLRVLVLGDLIRKREVAHFARTLGTLVKSGVPLLQALEVVEAVAGNQVIRQALKDVRVGVREGQGISVPLGRSGVFPTLALQMVSVGEETGRLDEMLMRVSEYYEKETHNQLRQLVSMVEPLLIVVMGLIVGFVVVAMLLGIFSMNDLPF